MKILILLSCAGLAICQFQGQGQPGLPPGFPDTSNLPAQSSGRSFDCTDRLSFICPSYGHLCAWYPLLKVYCKKTCGDCGGDCVDSEAWCPNSRAWCLFSHIGPRCKRTCGLCEDPPNEGEWDDWSDWSDCDEECGGGTQTRNRNCRSGDCNGPSEQERECNQQPCKNCKDDRSFGWCRQYSWLCRTNKMVQDSCKKTCDLCDDNSPSDGVWGPYGPWDDCSKTCGPGTQTRHRQCESGDCKGRSKQERNCNEGRCEGEWGEYGPWGDCGKTCGGGKQYRRRKCLSRRCTGKSTEERSCNEQTCPVSDCKDSAGGSFCYQWRRNCGSSWVKRQCKKTCNDCPKPDTGVWGPFGDWDECTKSCGGGTQRRTRTCTGGFCSGKDFEQRTCNDHTCPAKWGEFGDWSKCTKECGGGTQERTRQCLEGNCVGNRVERRDCNEQQCEGKWGEFGDWSKCTKECGGGTQERRRRCLSGTCVGSNFETRKCNEQDCVDTWGTWGPYGPWEKCTKTCGTGTQVRRRTCTGGGSCVGQATESRNCNMGPCPVSGCSKSCGIGTTYRTTFDGRVYSSCRTSKCTQQQCSSGQELMKDDMESKCCDSDSRVQCGKAGRGSGFTSRIIGGQNAAEKEFPWQAYLLCKAQEGAVVNRRDQVCGATIVSNKWLVTAAHCFKDGFYVYPTRLMSVVVGKIYVPPNRDSADFTNYNVQRAIYHPQFQMPVNDIGLVELRSRLTFTNKIQPACLFHGSEPGEDTSCYITGWGLVSNYATGVTPQLQKAVIEYFPYDVCRNAYTGDNFEQQVKNNENKMICAGSLSGGIDSCAGDSGGPLVCQNQGSCSFTLVGITSFGPNTCATDGKPGMYTKVSYYKNWINQYI